MHKTHAWGKGFKFFHLKVETFPDSYQLSSLRLKKSSYISRPLILSQFPFFTIHIPFLKISWQQSSLILISVLHPFQYGSRKSITFQCFLILSIEPNIHNTNPQIPPPLPCLPSRSPIHQASPAAWKKRRLPSIDIVKRGVPFYRYPLSFLSIIIGHS